MAANFLHGVETIEIKTGSRPIRVVKSAVTAVVGSAPIGDNGLNQILSPQSAVATYGLQLPGFTIPQALNDIYAQGASGAILVVNIFDPLTMTAQVTDESLTVTDGKASLAYAPIGAVVLTNSGATVTYVEGTDYSIDEFGNVKVLDFGVIAEGSEALATYKRLDATTITPSAIVGAVAGDGSRTGLKALEFSYTKFGYTPKIIIAPGYSTEDAVAAEMAVQAAKFRAIDIVDAPAGTDVSTAISGRGPAGTIAGFQSSSDRRYLAFPQWTVYNAGTDANETRPFSQILAGVIARTDLDLGYWYSPSNQEIRGVVGPEKVITSAINDAATEANALNEVGIVTYLNSFGTGYRTWGNRSAAYPSNTAPENFVAVRRVMDIIHESVELSMLQFIDKPINQAIIDSVRESVNGFLRVLIGRGALIDGQCVYNPAKNSEASLSAGQITFDIEALPPTPAERITFESFIDTSLFQNLA